MNENITALVVTYNEYQLLDDCLQKLLFCNQIILVDLSPSKEGELLAKKFHADYMSHEWVAIGEMIRPDILPYVNNNWILHIDPDEIVPDELATEIQNRINDSDRTGLFALPLINYFMEKPVKGTIWGGVSKIKILFHKERVNFTPEVHRPMTVKPGYVDGTISCESAIIHKWATSYKEFIKKHLRYIALEGKAKYNSGEQFSGTKTIKTSIYVLFDNLFRRRGILGGYREIFLSFFYTFYVFSSELSLKKYENLLKNER